MLMRLFFIQIVVSERKQLSLMSDEKSLSRIFHRRFATKSLRNEVKMINFNNKKKQANFFCNYHYYFSIGNGCADGGISPALLIIT